MSKPDAPDPPDYAAMAREQGKANTTSAIASNYLNQVGQVGPYGSLTYNYDNTAGMRLPDGTRIPKVTATTVLSPDQQRLLNQQTGISHQLNDLASEGIGYVRDTVGTPASPSGLPSMAGGLARTNFRGQAAPTAEEIMANYDFSGVTAMPNRDEFNQSRDQVTEAYMARLQPYMDRDRAAMENKLANQGITLGSEAHGWDNDNFNRGVNDQRIAALLAGDQEAQRLFGNTMSMRGQGINEAIQQGNFRNSAQSQEFQQNQAGLENENQAAQAEFAQGLASDQFGNAARAQAIQEQDYYRNQPLNMLNALRSGGQVNLPQFGNVSGGAQIAPAPIYQSAQDQYAAQMQNYQQKMAAQNGLLQGAAGIGSAAIMASDYRLKRDIQSLGIWVRGLPVYLYKYIWDDVQRIGVMAQDAEKLRPEVLGPRVNGFMTVDYGAI